jgi:predicted RNase H-like HicB family nuclease
MKDTYIFPAIFTIADDGISIEFPDLPGCFSCADNMPLALKRAKEAMQLHLYYMEKDGDEIPVATNPTTIKLESCEFVTMIEGWMPPFREKMLQKTIQRRIKLPKWLDEVAQREKVNLSAFLEESLKKHLGVAG